LNKSLIIFLDSVDTHHYLDLMLQQLNSWLDRYREIAFDLIRIYLGIGLFARGILFFMNAESFVALLPQNAPSWLLYDWVHDVVAGIHAIGGLSITIGLWSRISSLIQIPILSGAIFLSLGSLFSASQSFELSCLVLLLLVLVVFCGSGKWSLDRKIFTSQNDLQIVLARLYPLRSQAFDLLRIYLGFSLLIRGIFFIADSNHFIDLIGSNSSAFLRSVFLLHYVALSHLLGGFMLLFGLLSRLGALLQIPVLVGAVFVEEMSGGLTSGTQGFEIAVLTLFLLVLIFLYGSGRISLDHFFFNTNIDINMKTPITDQAAKILRQDLPEEDEFVDPVETLAVPEPFSVEESIQEISENPNVVSQARYSFWGWMLFLIDVTPRPIEIVFKDVRTGRILRRSKDPAVLQRFRYR